VTLPAESTARSLRVLRYAYSYGFGDGEHLLLGGIGQFTRRDGVWQPLPSPLPSRAELLWATFSPDAMRLCAVAVDGSGWLVDASGARAVPLPFPSDHCRFSPDASLAAFTGRPGRNELRLTDLNGTAVADFDSVYLQVDFDDSSYGTSGKNLVRLNWYTLELVTLPSPPHWCESRGEDATVWHDVQTLISSSTLVVEQHCACTDCHASGVYLLQLSLGASPQPLLSPTEWQVLQISPLHDTSVLIARSWRSGTTEFEGGDRLLRVSPDGSVHEIGPFPALPTPLHAPLAAPLRSR
jgi:hypothetical protein